MTTGIYKLTFPSGKFYIGKSIDIDKRWKQHFDKFSKHRHTANMQAEYDIYRTYEQEVLISCHEDHIDILEETYIARLRPALNCTTARDRLYNSDVKLDWFNLSTLEHIAIIEKYEATVNTIAAEMATNTSTINMLHEKLRKQRSREEVNSSLYPRIDELQDKCTALEEECEELNNECQELWKYKKLPWWKKLWT